MPNITVHNNDNTCLTKPKLPTSVRKIFREKFEKKHKHLLNIVSRNFEITMKEIKYIKIEINDLKKSIKFTKNVLKEKLQRCQK